MRDEAERVCDGMYSTRDREKDGHRYFEYHTTGWGTVLQLSASQDPLPLAGLQLWREPCGGMGAYHE